MWSTSQQKYLKVKPSVSRLTTWKLLIRAFSPGGEGGTRVSGTAWLEIWNWEVWGRKAGCWRKPTHPPWQSWNTWGPGLQDSNLWNVPLAPCHQPLSLGLGFSTSQSPVTLLCLFSGYLMGKKAPELLFKWRESPVGVGLAPLWLQGRILNKTLGWWPTPGSSAWAWLLSTMGLVIPSGGQWHGAFLARDAGSCLSVLTPGLQQISCEFQLSQGRTMRSWEASFSISEAKLCPHFSFSTGSFGGSCPLLATVSEIEKSYCFARQREAPS